MLVTGVVSSRVGHKCTLLAYTPFPSRLDARGLGLVFFGWGVMPALTSVFLAPRVQARFGTLPTMYAMLLLAGLDLALMGVGVTSRVVLVIAVIIGGAAAVFVSIAILFSGRAYLSKV